MPVRISAETIPTVAPQIVALAMRLRALAERGVESESEMTAWSDGRSAFVSAIVLADRRGDLEKWIKSGEATGSQVAAMRGALDTLNSVIGWPPGPGHEWTESLLEKLDRVAAVEPLRGKPGRPKTTQSVANFANMRRNRKKPMTWADIYFEWKVKHPTDTRVSKLEDVREAWRRHYGDKRSSARK